ARELTGPSFRATLQRDRWQVTAGEIFQSDDPVTGAYLNGTGVSGSWNAGGVRASATVAESKAIGISSGRLASADVVMGTQVGEFGVAMRAEERAALAGIDQGSLYGGALTFRSGTPSGLRARASGGLVRVAGPAETS